MSPNRNILFIHGMFLNACSWEDWEGFFLGRGYNCITPSWPLHDGNPAELRASPPPGLGELSLEEVVAEMEQLARPYDDLILVGHSVGGLIVQRLMDAGIGVLGIPICSVAPNRMMSLDWGMVRNVTSIVNPLAGDDLYPMDEAGFFKNFGNTMSRPDSDAAFRKYAMPESRNVLRDCLADAGKVDLELEHPPLLFIGAEQDEIIPPELCEKNAKAYSHAGSRADFVEFKKRGHFICGQPGWEEVASYVDAWIQQHGEADIRVGQL